MRSEDEKLIDPASYGMMTDVESNAMLSSRR
jgi:hypothetical protein